LSSSSIKVKVKQQEIEQRKKEEKMVSDRQKRRWEAQRKIIQHFDEQLPYFTDIFDERTFYICFGCLCVACIIAAIILSYCCRVEIKDADELQREREKHKRKKQQKLLEKFLKKKLAKQGLNGTELDLKKKEELEKLLHKLNANRKFNMMNADHYDSDFFIDEEEQNENEDLTKNNDDEKVSATNYSADTKSTDLVYCEQEEEEDVDSRCSSKRSMSLISKSNESDA
jgi:hypothetical protein